MTEADVLIIGRGVAGCALALALRKRGIKNIIVAGRESAAVDNIPETLPLAGYELLCRIGIGHLIEKYPVSAGIISKWNGEQTLVRESVFEVFETSRQLDKAVFLSDCHEQLVKENISSLTVNQLLDVQREDDSRWRLGFSTTLGECRIAAKFVVDASGRNAVFARKLGAKKIMLDRQVAVTGFLSQPEKTPGKIASFIESLPDGWCYSGLTPAGLRFVSLFTDADIVTDLGLNRKQWWLKYMRRSELFNSLAPGAKLTSLSVCPASSYFMEPTDQPGWLAIGDAAYGVDPLSSAGMFHALHTALSSADPIAKYLGGQSSALQELHHTNRCRFEDYLQQRLKMYRLVTHFATCKYWERRHERVSISPAQLLECCDFASGANEVNALNSYLSPAEWQDLYALCRGKSPAHAVVSGFSKLRPAVPVRRTIQALQLLIAHRLVDEVEG